MKKRLIVPVLAVVWSTCPALAEEDDERRGASEIRAWARELEASVNLCDPSFLEASVDFARLVERGIGDLDAPAPVKQQFAGGVARGFDLARGICRDIEQGGSYTLLRVRQVDGQSRALFRLIGPGGVNYHELVVERDERLEITDIYVYSSGEWLSQIVRRGFTPVAARLGHRGGAGAGDADRLFLRHIPEIRRMQQLFAEQGYSEAIAVFRSLPPVLKTHRTVLMLRFSIATMIGGEEYDAAMSDLRNAFPEDPTLALVLIDYHFNRGEHGAALESIDRVDRAVGGDPYLDYFRANVLLAAGRPERAKRAARRAIEAEPALEDPYWALVAISLDERRYRETARLLTLIEDELGLTIADLRGIPEYRGFVDSEAYAHWVAKREGP